MHNLLAASPACGKKAAGTEGGEPHKYIRTSMTWAYAYGVSQVRLTWFIRFLARDADHAGSATR
jgi:hypothetical protein